MGNAVATQSNAVNLPDASAAVVRSTLTVSGNVLPASDAGADLGASGTEWNNLFIDGTANIDSLVADTAQISDLTQNRVTFAGASGELSDNSAFTVNTTDSTLTATNVDVGAGITFYGHGGAAISGITTIGGALDVNSTSNFADDVVFAGASANITFDQNVDDLIFDDDAQAIFGSSSDGLHIFHDGSHSQIQDQGTGNLYITGNASVNIDKQSGEQMANFVADGEVELFHNNVKIFQTTGAGVTVGLSSIQHNGNAAFPGITTLGSPLSHGIPSEIIANQRITANAGVCLLYTSPSPRD